MFKKGDRVRITASIYSGHPSRMVGGTGTVEGVGEDSSTHGVGGCRRQVVSVAVDGDPDRSETWEFFDDELELIEPVEAVPFSQIRPGTLFKPAEGTVVPEGIYLKLRDVSDRLYGEYAYEAFLLGREFGGQYFTAEDMVIPYRI